MTQTSFNGLSFNGADLGDLIKYFPDLTVYGLLN